METLSVSINYEQLLKKYVQHIVEVEGVDFIDSCPIDPMYEPLGYTMFTEDEVNALKQLAGKK